MLGPRLAQALLKNAAHRKLALRSQSTDEAQDSIWGKQALSDAVDKMFADNYDTRTSGPRVRKREQIIGISVEQDKDAHQEMEQSVRAICPEMEAMDLILDELRGIIFLVNANYQDEDVDEDANYVGEEGAEPEEAAKNY